jgi:hypothetical protein
MSRDSSVGKMTGYRLDVWISIPGKRQKCFSSLLHPNTLCGSHNLLSVGEMRPGNEADHSPPSSVEVRTGGAVTPHVFMARGQLFFYLHAVHTTSVQAYGRLSFIFKQMLGWLPGSELLLRASHVAHSDSNSSSTTP